MTAIKRVRSGPRESTKRRNVKSSLSLATDHRSRTKDYLDAAEIDLLLKAAKAGRYGTRDSLLLMMLYRQGLWVSETMSLRVTDVNFQQARLWVNRLKNGLSIKQPIPGDELHGHQTLSGQMNHWPVVVVTEWTRPASDKAVGELHRFTVR